MKFPGILGLVAAGGEVATGGLPSEVQPWLQGGFLALFCGSIWWQQREHGKTLASMDRKLSKILENARSWGSGPVRQKTNQESDGKPTNDNDD